MLLGNYFLFLIISKYDRTFLNLSQLCRNYLGSNFMFKVVQTCPNKFQFFVISSFESAISIDLILIKDASLHFFIESHLQSKIGH